MERRRFLISALSSLLALPSLRAIAGTLPTTPGTPSGTPVPLPGKGNTLPGFVATGGPNGTAEYETLDEWLRAPRTPVREWPHVPPGTMVTPDEGFFLTEEWRRGQTIVEAIARNSDITFTYRNGTGSETMRRATPALFFFVGENVPSNDGPYYVTGYCHHRHATRTFRFDRMSAVAMKDGPAPLIP